MALNQLQEIIDTFQSVDEELRLELLLDYAKKLPPLPERFHAQRDAGLHKVPECQTPVFMWVETDDQGTAHIYVDVAEEAPTVQGLLSIIVHGCEGEPAEAVTELPSDLINQLGLGEKIRMQRHVGLTGIIGRIKQQIEKANQAQAS
jgi:cysteine desulfuration protein SufE